MVDLGMMPINGRSVYPRIMCCVLCIGWMLGGGSRLMLINCISVYPRIMSCVLCMGWMVDLGMMLAKT